MAKEIKVTRYVTEQDVEIYINSTGTVTGMSQSGLALMTMTNESSVRRWMENNGHNPIVATVLGSAQVGVKGQVNVINYDICSLYVFHVLGSDKVTKEARNQCLEIVKVTSAQGFKTGLQKVAGYFSPEDKYQARLANHGFKSSEECGGFLVIEAAERVIRVLVDNLGYDEEFAPEVSMGLVWAKYRKDNGFPPPLMRDFPARGTYGQAIREGVCLYSLDELPVFKRWLYEIYIPNNLGKYIKGKFGPESDGVQRLEASKPTWFQKLLG